MPIVNGKNTSKTEIDGDGNTLHIPQINMNGTGESSLKTEIEVATHAISDAIEAVGIMTVHGRDWQTVADDTEYREARAEQIARLAKLSEVKDELVAIWKAIDEQGRKY